MTQMRVVTRNGCTLTYDTDDVEDITFSTLSDAVEVPHPEGKPVVCRELTGYTHLDLHIDFKHGKRALWVKTDELALSEMRAMAGYLARALDAEDIAPELKSRIFNRFMYGDPRGLDAPPMRREDSDEQIEKIDLSADVANFRIDTPPLAPPIVSVAERAPESLCLEAQLQLSEGGRALAYDPDGKLELP